MVWSTISWDLKKKEASAWMPRTFVDGLMEKDFVCDLYMTDIWMTVAPKSSRLAVKKAAKRGMKWDESKSSDGLVHR